MVRRRASLARASHSADPDRHHDHAIVLDGIRASFIPPRDRHASIVAMQHEHDFEPLVMSVNGAARPALASLYHNQDPARPRFSWMKEPSLKSVVAADSHESDALIRKDNLYGTSLREGDEEADMEDMTEGPKSTPSKATLWTARFYLILSAILYGTAYPLVKILDDTMPVPVSLTLRFGMASLVTLPWLFESPAVDWNTSIQATVRGAEVGLWDCLGFLAQALALMTTTSNKAAFFCGLDVVVVPFLDKLIGVSLERIQFIAAGMAVFGVGLLELEGGSLTFSAGDLWSLLQPVAFGIGFWRTEQVLEHYPDEANRITAAQLLACFLFSLIYAVVTFTVEDSFPTSEEFIEWLSSAQIVVALLWTGIVTTALTVYLETVAMRTISAAETTLLISSEPFWASLFAWILVGETLGALGLLGGVFIIGACILGMW